MAFLDGPAQVFLLIVVFCCPIIPAGGWCWLKSIECCLRCLGSLVRNVRRYAYVPMYLSLLVLLIAGCTTVVPDFFASEKTEWQWYAFELFLITTALSFFAVLISVCSTVKVLQGQASIDEQRERTVYIIALPSFYGLMCFLASQQLLEKVLGTVDEHWAWDVNFDSEKQREQFTLDMITFYMSAADVFESFAFTFFGMLTMESLRRAAQQQSRQGAREERLQSCIQKWTMSPIYMFCAVLCLESVYHLILIFGKYFHLNDFLPPALTHTLEEIPQPSEDVITISFFTLTSIFSTLAIMALFSIEHVFHEDLASVDFVLECASMKKCKFLSNLKFWGVKLFVTIEFTLDCAMFLLEKMNFDDVKKQLIYTTCMASLCLLMAILHIYAYAPKGRWIVSADALRMQLENEELEDAPARLTTISGVSLRIMPTSEIFPPTEVLSSKLLEAGLHESCPADRSTRSNTSADRASQN